MKPIIVDFLRRWNWVYILAVILQFGLNLIAPPTNSLFPLFIIIYCGSMLLAVDLARGTARVFQALPVTRRDLAWSWRSLAIIAPLLLFVFDLAMASSLRLLLGLGEVMSWSQATFCSVFAALWLGVCFHLLTLLPSVAPQSSRGKLKNGIVGLLWGASFAGGFLFLIKMPNDWQSLHPIHWLLLAGALVSTVLGWLNAEEMVINRASPTRASETGSGLTGRPQGPKLRAIRSEGLSFLFRTITGNTLKVTGFLMIAFIGFQVFLRKDNQEDWLGAAARVAGEPITFYMLPPLAMVTGLQWLSCVRHLKTLPLKGAHLTLLVSVFFILPLFLVLATMGLLEMSLGVHAPTVEWAARTFLVAAPVLFAPGLLLRLGLSLRSYFLVIAPIFTAAPISTLLAGYIPAPVCGLICLVGWTSGILLIHRSINRRTEPYRQSLNWPMRPA